MANQSATGIQRLINAAHYSAKGLRETFVHEAAFKQECVLLVVALPLAAWIADSALQFALLIGSIVLIMAVELLNSAVESVVDRISAEHHPLAGRAKDQASAAVLLTGVVALAIWIAVLVD